MKKFILLLPLLFACETKVNRARVMVEAQAPKADCSVPVEVAFCRIPSGDPKVESTYGVAVVSQDIPFQWNIVRTEAQLKKASATPPPAPPAGSGSAQ